MFPSRGRAEHYCGSRVRIRCEPRSPARAPRRVWRTTVTVRPALTPRWSVGFAVVYLIVAVVSRLTVVQGQTLSLVWPGAGVAVLWLLAESPHRQARVLAPLLAIHMAVAWVTG